MSRALKTNVAIEVLRGKCRPIASQEEAEVTTKMLEYLLRDYSNFETISAPEVNVMSAAAIIRTPTFSLDLINPTILDKKDSIIVFGEQCASFPHNCFNCVRYRNITIQTGVDPKVIQLSGHAAYLAQHAIDHLNSLLFYDKTVKLAMVRNDGTIRESDFCPCGSQKRFSKCCQMK